MNAISYLNSNKGNTNTGPVSERFFAPENRASICAKINKASDRAAYSTLLSLFNKMLSITQSSDIYRVVDVEKVKALGEEFMVHKYSFPWAIISLCPSNGQSFLHCFQ